MKVRHASNRISIHQVSRAASAPGLQVHKNPGADAARLTRILRTRGFTLVELLVVIAIISVILTMVGVLFHRLFLSEQLAMRAALTERGVSRLADQFRRDVRAAASVRRTANADDPATLLELTATDNPSASTVYSIGEGRVTRETFVDGSRTHHEVFRLPGCLIRFPDAAAPDEVNLISLVIERQGSTVTPQPQAARPRRSLVIEAALGRDRELALALVARSSAAGKEDSK